MCQKFKDKAGGTGGVEVKNFVPQFLKGTPEVTGPASFVILELFTDPDTHKLHAYLVITSNMSNNYFMTHNYEVIVIGGGIIGHATAFHLANNNRNVALINTIDYGLPASIAAAGLLTPYQKEEIENPFLKNFNFKSYEYFLNFYQQIKDHVNIDLGFNISGSLYLVFSNSEFAKKEMETRELKNIDSNISFLNKNEVAKTEPKITKDLVGAYHFPKEAYINNPKFLKSISQYLVDNSVSIFNSKVEELITTNNKIEKLILTNGKNISADKYVLCNGVWANKFLKQIFKTDEDFIKPIKGEILELSGSQVQLLNKIIFCQDGYALPRPATNQFENPSILIGSTSEEIDLLKHTNPFNNSLYGIQYLTKLFNKLFPDAKDCFIQDHWAGLRPKTKDAMPIIGKSENIENLYLGLGHYRNGILMGPYTGKLLCDLIESNKTEFDISAFKLERFLKSTYTKVLN